MSNKLQTMIIGELNEDGHIKCVTLELLHKVNHFDNEVILLLPVPKIKEDYKEIASKAGADCLILLENREFENYQTIPYAEAISCAIRNKGADIVLLGATKNGRDLAPRISTTLKTGLTADCTEINITDEGLLEATRPTYGGELMATIIANAKPQMATIRPFAFAKNPMNYNKDTQVITKEFDLKQHNSVRILEIIEQNSHSVDLENANIILAGGMGLKNAENFKLLDKLAGLIGASVGATLPVTARRWRPDYEQIGQTGKVVHPKLYLAFGISGAIHHVIGMDKSDTVIAINTDEHAP